MKLKFLKNSNYSYKSILFTFLVLISFLFFNKQTGASSDFPIIYENLKPKIISRKDWNAKAPVLPMKSHNIKQITIHHTATPQKSDISIEKKLQNLQAFSQREDKLASGKIKPIWADVPYHYYISVDGKIAEGRDINFAGDTNTDYDPTGHALIVLEGNFEIEKVSEKQKKAMQDLVMWISDEWKVSASEIKTHKDYASTACPGKSLFELMNDLRKKVSDSKI